MLPHTPPLFADYCANFAKIHAFFPQPPRLPDPKKTQLNYDRERRENVSTVLEQQNRAWGASSETLENIGRLRRGASALVTGQQVGLFGGPLYAFYKALSAIKFAQQVTQAGSDCVPVFWLATEDHDFAEVQSATFFSSAIGLAQLTLDAAGKPNQPVSDIQLGQKIAPLVEQAADLLGKGEMANLLRACYTPQENLGSAFARLFSNIFKKFGLIVLDPSHPDLRRIAAPIYQSALDKSDRLVDSLLERGTKLEAAGYEQQVKVTNSSTLLFRINRDGERLPVRRVNGKFLAGTEQLSAQQLHEEIAKHPERFSPNVLLRPVVQDYLLPTVAYVGGPSEIAYFAQANVVYQELLGRVTPILPRFSATLIDAKSRRIMEQYGVTIADIFAGPERLRERLAERHLPQELDSRLEQTRRVLEENLSAIVAELKKLDPTLVEAAERSVAKMEYQLDHLRKKAAHAQLRRQEELRRHADHLSSTIFPSKNLQEREIAAVSFLAQHGSGLLDRVYEAIQPACAAHHLLHI